MRKLRLANIIVTDPCDRMESCKLAYKGARVLGPTHGRHGERWEHTD